MLCLGNRVETICAFWGVLKAGGVVVNVGLETQAEGLDYIVRDAEASVLIAEDIAIEDIRSVMLEELFQTLGFIYDIENRYYEGRSILSQDSNATTTLIGQDRKALRRLYP